MVAEGLGHRPASSLWSHVVVRCFGRGVGPSTGLGDVVRCGGEGFQGSANNLMRLICVVKEAEIRVCVYRL